MSDIDALWFKFIRNELEDDMMVAIIKSLDFLYRKGKIKRGHLLILRKYGKKGITPSSEYENLDDLAWREALDILESLLVKKGIMNDKSNP